MADQAEALLKNLKPDLYRVNAFRLAQLRADAAPRDAARRLEKIKLHAKLGTAAEGVRGPLALQPPPDVDAVREAVERLNDPERRLVDEFFWFWPEPAEGADEALAAADRGDVATARKRWQEATASPVAGHNLAVLAHLLALDFEHRAMTTGRVLDTVLCKLRDQAWAEAWKHWKTLLEQPTFWDRFRERLRELNEPQLPEALADDFRRALPVALLGLNAQLAVQWAERRLPLEAERHKTLLRNSGLDAIDADEALRRALRPVRERIKMLCDSAAESGSHDSYQTALDLFKGVAPLPGRDSDRDNLLEDAGPALYRVCWFCQKAPGDSGSPAVVPMHGRVTRTKTGSGESVHWDRQFIEVPRCWHCSQAHQRWDMLKAVGAAPVGVRPETDKTAFPFVAKYIADGWGLGITPDGL
jgi:hypothetical protein